MSIAFDNSLFGNLSSSKDLNLSQDDELYMINQDNNGLCFWPLFSEDKKDIEDQLTKIFPPYFQNFEDQATNFETKKKENSLFANNNSDNSDTKIPKSFIFEDILKIFQQNYNESSNIILDNFKKDEIIEKYEKIMYLLR